MGPEELIVEAFSECIEDAGIDPGGIEAAWVGTCFDEINMGKSALGAAMALRLNYIPWTRVENYCASGTESLRGAVYAVASGAYETCLAMGVEKLKDSGYGGLPNPGSNNGPLIWLWFPNISAPGAFAQLATAYGAKYGVKDQDVKRAIAQVSVKSHENGVNNPKAHLPEKGHHRPGHVVPHHCPSSGTFRLLRGERRRGLRHRHHGGKGSGYGH